MKTAFAVIFLASSLFSQVAAVPPQIQPACGPANLQFRTTTDVSPPPDPQLEAGKALVYVVEDQRFKGIRDATARVGVDGAWVGATRGDSYLFFSVEPGEHHLCADWVSSLVPGGRAVALYGFTAEPGKVYYFRARTTGGPASMADRNGLGDAASIDLDLVNADEGKYLVASKTFIASHPKK
jgi:hypothetical protein